MASHRTESMYDTPHVSIPLLMNILVAEDEPMLRDMLSLELQENGQTVISAKDGFETIELLKLHKPDLLLLDLLMPRKDGFAVLEFIHTARMGVPVLVLTNISEPREEERCRALGARDFIVKSQCNLDEIWEKVRAFLELPAQFA